MSLTMWMNEYTGERLDLDALDALVVKARRAYEANKHIFEDQWEALQAFGVKSLVDVGCPR